MGVDGVVCVGYWNKWQYRDSQCIHCHRTGNHQPVVTSYASSRHDHLYVHGYPQGGWEGDENRPATSKVGDIAHYTMVDHQYGQDHAVRQSLSDTLVGDL